MTPLTNHASHRDPPLLLHCATAGAAPGYVLYGAQFYPPQPPTMAASGPYYPPGSVGSDSAALMHGVAAGYPAGGAPPPPGGPQQRAPGAEPDEVEIQLPDSIKLGLGDFIFYSMLVGRAAMYDYMTGAPAQRPCGLALNVGTDAFVRTCRGPTKRARRAARPPAHAVFASYLGIIAGLGLTLLCLAIFQRALPALPFSIALGVTFYFLTRSLLEPFITPLAVTLTYF